MKAKFSIGLAAILFFPALPWSTDFVGIDFRRNEFKIGLGKGISFEEDAFNLQNESQIDPDLAWNVEYDFNLDGMWSLGISIHGYRQEIPGQVQLSTGEIKDDENDFDIFNYGLKGKYYFIRNPIQPFGFISFNMVDGSVSRTYGPTVKLKGFSMGMGTGALVQISSHLGISLEGNINVGAGQWKAKPFLNSEGLEINPGYMGLVLNLAYLW
jgi:hypothetical protein